MESSIISNTDKESFITIIIVMLKQIEGWHGPQFLQIVQNPNKVSRNTDFIVLCYMNIITISSFFYDFHDHT